MNRTITMQLKSHVEILSKVNPMKRLIIPILMLCFAITANSQQDETIFRHYFLNHVMVNPAASGYNGVHELRLNMRNQFASFPGAPQTYSIGYNGPIGNSFGLGVNVLTENIASLNRYRLQLAYAFKFNLSPDFILNAGISTEFHQMRIPNGADDNLLFDVGDILIADATDGLNIFDATLGFYGKYKENTFFSLAIPNLIRARLDQVVVTDNEPSSFLQHFLLMGGHRFQLANQSTYIEPSMMISKVMNTPIIFDANVKASFLDEKISGAVTFRTGPNTSVGFMLGTKVNVLQLYYSYDSHMGQFSTYNQGSHEVTLGFAFGAKKSTPATSIERNSSKRYRR